MSWQEVEQSISKFGKKENLIIFGVVGVAGMALLKSKASAPTSIMVLGAAYLAGNVLSDQLLDKFFE